MLEKEEHKGFMEITKHELNYKESNISYYYHFMSQLYNVMNTKGQNLLIKEEVKENAFTYQVPYLYLLMRANDLTKLLLECNEETDQEFKEVYEEVISKYHEQIKVLELNWSNLDLDNMKDSSHIGPRAFKPSVEKNMKGLEGVALNLHNYSIEIYPPPPVVTTTEVGTSSITNQQVIIDQHSTVTLGCPSVHVLKSKIGGLRKLLENRLTFRSKLYLNKKMNNSSSNKLPRPSSMKALTNNKSVSSSIFSSKNESNSKRKDSTRAFQALSVKLDASTSHVSKDEVSKDEVSNSTTLDSINEDTFEEEVDEGIYLYAYPLFSINNLSFFYSFSSLSFYK